MILKKRIIFIIFGLGLLALAAGFILLSQLKRPVTSQNADPVRFTVPRGQATSVIADRLHEAGLIRHPLVFQIVIKQKGFSGKLQAGSFEISPDMTPVEIAELMTQGTEDIWVTIPEGWRREQIASSLAEHELPAFDEAEFLSLTVQSEGKLFPDTYLFARESTAATIQAILLNTFESKVTQGLAKEIAAADQDIDQILVMASIVEREARGYEEMRHVAAILWNRVELGMPLQADATLQYINGYDEETDNWWPQPLAADKSLNSPYNTYLNPGLPPRPISNPGYDAIKATLNPISTSDLYYLHDRSGAIHYGRTLEEHNANVQRYLR